MAIDIFILVVLLWASYDGWRDGFIKQLVSAIGFFVGLIVAALCYSAFGKYLTVDGSQVNMLTSVIAFFLLWIVVPIVLGTIAKMLTSFLKGIHLGWLNSLLGVGTSVLKYLILLSCIFNVLTMLQMLPHEKTEDSRLFQPTYHFISFAFEKTQKHVGPVIEQQLDKVKNDTTWINWDSKQ